MPYLVSKSLDGSVAGQWELGEKTLIFGRGTQSDVRLPDDRISRQHFAVVRKDDGFYVQDLKSTNGTWVNNERVTEALLKPNDKIRAGQTIIVFLAERPKGLATIMNELEAEGKGLRTYINEMSERTSALPNL
jgi:pSer/pThr/pTyr-binding forkhead associated (FHA) protein